MRETLFTTLAFTLVAGCGGGNGPSEARCREIGNQPPCCEFFGHRETPDGRCEETFDAAFDTSRDTGFDTGFDTALDTGLDTGLDAGDSCERNDECVSTGPETLQCCPGGACDLGPCITGPAPPPACQDREPSDTCGEEMVCVNDATCGWGDCRRDCRLDGDCAALGLDCDGEICTFDCTLADFAGCPSGQVCRENAQCGAPPCDATSCGLAADCTPVAASPFSHRNDGCRPKACSTSTDCPAATFCINGGCSSEQVGMCGDATTPP